ncbi:hypothetical protein ARTHRO9V_1280004 [Arthrobacter sp. 9V]|nr:hypothetical protein ARTHRO9V_1280004 [Arthrobacter sp. 9V]VXB98033.1 hypothetical protein CURTO8I2_320090 [Curtobacterium sp. 8I-2]
MQVADAPGASEFAATGQSTAERSPVPENAPSLTVASVRVTLPVFVKRNEYVTVSPTFAPVAGLADFTSDSDGFGVDGTVTVDGSDGTGVPLPGGVPVAVAEFVVDPRSTSAWVRVYVAVKVLDAPGARDATEAGVSVPS